MVEAEEFDGRTWLRIRAHNGPGTGPLRCPICLCAVAFKHGRAGSIGHFEHVRPIRDECRRAHAGDGTFKDLPR